MTISKFLLAALPAALQILHAQTDVRDALVQDLRNIHRGLETLTGEARRGAESLFFDVLERYLLGTPLEQLAELGADLQLVRAHVCRTANEERAREAAAEPVEPEIIEAEVIDETSEHAEPISASHMVARLKWYLYSTEADVNALADMDKVPCFDPEFWAVVRQAFQRGQWSAFGFSTEEQALWQRDGVLLGDADMLRNFGYDPTVLRWTLAENDRRRLSVMLERILPTTYTVGELLKLNLPHDLVTATLTRAAPGAA